MGFDQAQYMQQSFQQQGSAAAGSAQVAPPPPPPPLLVLLAQAHLTCLCSLVNNLDSKVPSPAAAAPAAAPAAAAPAAATVTAAAAPSSNSHSSRSSHNSCSSLHRVMPSLVWPLRITTTTLTTRSTPTTRRRSRWAFTTQPYFAQAGRGGFQQREAVPVPTVTSTLTSMVDQVTLVKLAIATAI